MEETITKIPREEFDMMSPWANMRRCVLKNDGTVHYYLHPENSAFKEDGTPADLTGKDGQVMVEIPKFYWRAEPNANTHKWYLSSEKQETLCVHPAFFRDRDGDGIAEEVDYRYVSAFMGVVGSDDMLRSLPSFTPTISKTLAQMRIFAENRGQGWGIWDYYLVQALELLYLAEYADFDAQSTIGSGAVKGFVDTGSTLPLGNKTGTAENINDGYHSISYRGIEDFWGNRAWMIDGFLTTYKKFMLSNKNFNDTGKDYTIITTDAINFAANVADCYGDSALGFLPFYQPTVTTGNLHDVSYLDTTSAQYVCYPIFGGAATTSTSYTVYSGAFHWSISPSSIYGNCKIGETNANFSAGLAY